MRISHPGFLLDLDGLLINSESLSEIAFEKMCKKLGCEFSEDYHASIRGTKKELWSASLVETFQLSASAMHVAELHDRLLLSELDNAVQLMPGAKVLLDWIDSRAYPKALVTSSDPSYARRYLGKLELLDRFSIFVTSEDVKTGKPDPEPYQIGAKRLNRVPSDCIVFEDSVNGAMSGKSSGALVIAVPSSPSDKYRMAIADFVLQSLDESILVLENMGL